MNKLLLIVMLGLLFVFRAGGAEGQEEGGLRTVTIEGSVKQSGIYTLKHSENLLFAIAKAGGMDRLADRTRIYVVRGQGTMVAVDKIDLENLIMNTQDYVLCDKDRVFIPYKD